jgi:hypothetical protein
MYISVAKENKKEKSKKKFKEFDKKEMDGSESLRKGFLGSTTHYLSNRIKKGITQWFTVRYLEDIFVQVQYKF